MLRTNECVTTVDKKGYPWIGKIEEIYPNGITAKCLFSDMGGCLSRHKTSSNYY